MLKMDCFCIHNAISMAGVREIALHVFWVLAIKCHTVKRQTGSNDHRYQLILRQREEQRRREERERLEREHRRQMLAQQLRQRAAEVRKNEEEDRRAQEQRRRLEDLRRQREEDRRVQMELRRRREEERRRRQRQRELEQQRRPSRPARIESKLSSSITIAASSVPIGGARGIRLVVIMISPNALLVWFLVFQSCVNPCRMIQMSRDIWFTGWEYTSKLQREN